MQISDGIFLLLDNYTNVVGMAIHMIQDQAVPVAKQSDAVGWRLRSTIQDKVHTRRAIGKFSSSEVSMSTMNQHVTPSVSSPFRRQDQEVVVHLRSSLVLPTVPCHLHHVVCCLFISLLKSKSHEMHSASGDMQDSFPLAGSGPSYCDRKWEVEETGNS